MQALKKFLFEPMERHDDQMAISNERISLKQLKPGIT